MQVQKISDTIQKFDGVSYYRCGPYFQRKGKRLHRTVWEFHNGPIPAGYDIHHIDGDRANNDIDNLQLLEGSEHGRVHMTQPERLEKSMKAIVRAQEAASAWHGTQAGFEMHSRIARDYWAQAKPETFTCSCCGKEFRSRGHYGKESNTFCSNNCKSEWRRRHGIDNETRTCPVCGAEFSVNRYLKQACCSRECARRKRWGHED